MRVENEGEKGGSRGCLYEGVYDVGRAGFGGAGRAGFRDARRKGFGDAGWEGFGDAGWEGGFR